jgi:hypothetical protein
MRVFKTDEYALVAFDRMPLDELLVVRDNQPQGDHDPWPGTSLRQTNAIPAQPISL